MDTKLIVNFVMGALCCWASIALFDAVTQFIEKMKNGFNGEFFFIDLMPFLILVVAILIYPFFAGAKGRGKLLSRLTPDEFEEQDEREKAMLANACRSAYVTMSYSSDCRACFMLLSAIANDVPLFSDCHNVSRPRDLASFVYHFLSKTIVKSSSI